jgi:hypothetical protein
MDYSLYLIVVIKPYRDVDYIKQSVHGLDLLQIGSREIMRKASKGLNNTKKRLYIGETDPNLYKKKDQGDLLLVKEKSSIR